MASLKRAGGLVCSDFTTMSSVDTVSPCFTATSCGPPPSLGSPGFPSFSSLAASLPYTASQPGLTSTLPSVLKASPSTRVMRVVIWYSAAG